METFSTLKLDRIFFAIYFIAVVFIIKRFLWLPPSKEKTCLLISHRFVGTDGYIRWPKSTAHNCCFWDFLSKKYLKQILTLKIDMRQLQILFNETRTWHRIVCWFLWIYLFLPVLAWCDHKIVFFFFYLLSHHKRTGKIT